MPISIFVVDDDPEQHRLLENTVRALGYEAIPAGDAALRSISTTDADRNVRILTRADFPQAALEGPAVTAMPERSAKIAPGVSTIDALDADGELRPFAEVEADVIRFALAHHRGCMALVARKLGIGRSTLYRKLKELNFEETDGIAAQ